MSRVQLLQYISMWMSQRRRDKDRAEEVLLTRTKVLNLRMCACAFLMPILLSAFKKSHPARMHICKYRNEFHQCFVYPDDTHILCSWLR